jgi:hypothetical protein
MLIFSPAMVTPLRRMLPAGCLEAGDQAQHGGLAAARRAQQAGDFALRQIEGQLTHHGCLP